MPLHHAVRFRPLLETLECRANPAFVTTLFNQHVDIDIHVDEGQLTIGYHDEDADQELEADEAQILVRTPARTTQPADPNFSFTGAADGAPIWILPQVPNPNLVLLGIGSEEIESGTFATYDEPLAGNATGEWLRVALIAVRGPGQFSAFAAGVTPDVKFASADGINAADTAAFLVGGHSDLNFAFTAAGRYEIDLQASAFNGPGMTEQVSSAVTTLVFMVDPPRIVASATNAGAVTQVRISDAVTNATITTITPFGSGFQGGARIAVADVNRDGFADVIVAPGVGAAPFVRVYSGATNYSLIANLQVYGSAFRSGIFVAAGDVNEDGFADLIVSPQAGSPVVKVYSGNGFGLIRSIQVFGSSYTRGLTVAAGDVNRDGTAEVIVGTYRGTSSVAAYNGVTGVRLYHYLAFTGFTGGVTVAASDINSDGFDEVVVGQASGGGQVRVLQGTFTGTIPAELALFNPFGTSYIGGVNVGKADIEADQFDEVLTGPLGGVASTTRFWSFSPTTLRKGIPAFGTAFRGGIYVDGSV